MTKTKERRSYSRISIALKGYMRRVPSPEAPPLFKDGPQLGASPDARTFRGVNLPDALVSFLNNMNEKLDLLLSLASQDQLHNDFPMVLDTAELSGSGVAFECPEELVVGEYVEIVLILSQFPLKMGGAIGRVVRKFRRSNRTLWAVKFSKMRDTDREAIIQTVFQEQRALIRQRSR